MKGIILAGGSGTRLHPLTIGVSKQLMPIYDKPMIYYPLGTLLECGINEILIISTPQDISSFEKLLGTGKKIGCKFSYAVQQKPNGLAEAFIIGDEFIGNDKVALILGDNIFHGQSITKALKENLNPDGASIFAYPVKDPERYGVVDFDKHYNVISIEEKPKNPKSNYAVPGIYFYDNRVIEYAKNLKPSDRGELEITDLNKIYLQNGKLKVGIFDTGSAWLDTGTFESLQHANQYVYVLEQRQGIKIGCIEEIAFNKGFINKSELHNLAIENIKSGYGEYLLNLIESKKL